MLFAIVGERPTFVKQAVNSYGEVDTKRSARKNAFPLFVTVTLTCRGSPTAFVLNEVQFTKSLDLCNTCVAPNAPYSVNCVRLLTAGCTAK